MVRWYFWIIFLLAGSLHATLRMDIADRPIEAVKEKALYLGRNHACAQRIAAVRLEVADAQTGEKMLVSHLSGLVLDPWTVLTIASADVP